jgi:AcrR family transcriptional regulator
MAMTQAPSGADRRKARTRSALVKAAQQLIAQARTNVPILEITQLADVGMGSFYNHFESREALFSAAVDDALELQGAVLDALTGDLADPAEVFAQSFRLTGRMHRAQPELSRVLLSLGPAQIGGDRGLAPRALRDVRRAKDAGRFIVADPEVALMIIGGAAITLGQMLLDHPELDAATTTDQMTEDILRMLGLDTDDAADVVRRPLPEGITIAESQWLSGA